MVSVSFVVHYYLLLFNFGEPVWIVVAVIGVLEFPADKSGTLYTTYPYVLTSCVSRDDISHISLVLRGYLSAVIFLLSQSAPSFVTPEEVFFVNTSATQLDIFSSTDRSL